MAEDEKKPLKVTDIESARMNIESAVQATAYIVTGKQIGRAHV